MNKGDVVKVHAIVDANYILPHNTDGGLIHNPPLEHSIKKRLFHYPVNPWIGIVVGTSYRATGYYYSGQRSGSFRFDDDLPEPPSLSSDKLHLVIMVQPLSTQRWLRPATCLEKDLEIVASLQEMLEAAETDNDER